MVIKYWIGKPCQDEGPFQYSTMKQNIVIKKNIQVSLKTKSL